MSLLVKLEPATYSQDEVVGIAVASREELPCSLDDGSWQYISERLWNRLLHLGSAYELHFAAILDPSVYSVLNATQCATFEDELRFLGTVVEDNAFKTALRIILSQVEKVQRRPEMALVFSPP